jgi:hypothetical protein
MLVFTNCYFWAVSKQQSIIVNFDKNQFKRFGDKTYLLYILKCSVTNIIKGKNKTEIKLMLQDNKNWQKYYKLNWNFAKNKRSSSSCSGCSDVVDYRKYNFSVLDTSVLEIESIDHVQFENSGLGQIMFKVKKDGATKLIGKNGNTILEQEIISKDGIITMKYNYPDWKETVIGPIWF